MIEVKNRSVESWGPLAHCDDKKFNALINGDDAKTRIKTFIKNQKKLKKYRVQFIKEWESADSFELYAEDDYCISAVADAYFKENEDKIGFKEKPRSKWAGGFKGYSSIRYTKIR